MTHVPTKPVQLTTRAIGICIAAAMLLSASPAMAGGCIDVERASAKQLQGLTNVGPALAKAIVAHRKTMRAKATKAKKRTWTFGNWATLMTVRGVGPKVCQANISKVCFSGRVQKKCPAAKGKNGFKPAAKKKAKARRR